MTAVARRALRALLTLGCAGALALPAAAQSRPVASAMACAEVQALVQRSGALVLNYTPTTYDRVVANGRFCLGGQVTVPDFAATRDKRQCFVGYLCKEFEIEPN